MDRDEGMIEVRKLGEQMSALRIQIQTTKEMEKKEDLKSGEKKNEKLQIGRNGDAS